MLHPDPLPKNVFSSRLVSTLAISPLHHHLLTKMLHVRYTSFTCSSMPWFNVPVDLYSIGFFLCVYKEGADSRVSATAAAKMVFSASTASPEVQRAVADRDAKSLVILLQASAIGARQSVASGIAILADAPPDQSTDPMREAFAAAGAFPPLVAMLRDGATEERAAAAEALWKLSRNAAVKAAIAAAGGIEPLVTLVRNGDAQGKANAAAALGNLACSNDANKAAIRSAGGIEPLVTLVRDGEAQGKASAAYVLGSLADGDDANKEAIMAAGGIKPLVTLVRNGDAQGKADAAGALGILADGNDANKEAIRSAGGIVPLAALVRDGDAEGKADAARALGILGIDSSPMESGFNGNADSLL